MSRRLEGLPVGRMVPAQPAADAPPLAACAKCGARLSRYREWSDGAYCAPCQRTIKADAELRVKPFVPAPTREHPKPHGGARRCACGAFLHRDTKGDKCRVCYEEPRNKPARRCAECAKPISYGNKSGLCWECVLWNRSHAAAQRAPARCPDCGGEKSKSSERCLACDNKRRLHPDRVCPECGGRKALKRALLCRACRDRAGGARNARKQAA